MSLDAPYRQFYQWAEKYGEWLYLPAPNHIATRLQEPDALRAFARLLAGARVYLATVVANDERELEDHCFKIYYLFSHPIADLFLTVEYLLGQGAEFYPSLFALFPAVDPFERKIRDLFGLKAIRENGETVQPRSWLHAPYPADLFPLRRDRTNAQLKQAVDAYNRDGLDRSTPVETMSVNPGSLLLSVGPVHAGIIEPGRFVFRIAGEVIDDLTIFLGYAHKGIERLFQTRLTLMDGWRLAEQVSGDSAFAHGLAYCRAVETLANAPPSPAAELLRGLFLELERIYNHIGDVAALAQDVALEQIASEIAVVRENLVRLNAAIAGHRYLRGLNRPGGICLPQPLDCARIAVELPSAVEAFNILAEKSMNLSAFRDRTIEAGVLTASDALATGATGLAARASGIARDFRCNHPNGVYCESWLRPGMESSSPFGKTTSVETTRGDVYARFLMRVREVNTSATLIHAIFERWKDCGEKENTNFLTELRFNPDKNFTFALGYAEGWRGEIIYWLMQDKMERIYRCQVRDPSMLNWLALRCSIVPHEVEGKRVETILPDFPLINKSFNLSYSGNDL